MLAGCVVGMYTVATQETYKRVLGFVLYGFMAMIISNRSVEPKAMGQFRESEMCKVILH